MGMVHHRPGKTIRLRNHQGQRRLSVHPDQSLREFATTKRPGGMYMYAFTDQARLERAAHHCRRGKGPSPSLSGLTGNSADVVSLR